MVVEILVIQKYSIIILTFNITLSLIVMLAACICCTKKKVPKNELLGLEGMVKLKNIDDVIIVNTVGVSESQADLNSSTVSNADSDKRASTAAHRSLPDIPIAEGNGDNGSELYETVADKRITNIPNDREKSPIQNLKKQISVSQHSSISQADDVSSPYSRVKNSPHDYAKLHSAEHPYAQLNAPSTSTTVSSDHTTITINNSGQLPHMNTSDAINRNSHHSDTSCHTQNESGLQHIEIPAASAIAGMISASQDLPYMTPPISNQHFSGDSQDSSKGYTSISVREPLANILAQQPISKPIQRGPRETGDSHYATVSDDSDETYAAIEDPNSRLATHNPATDIYTSGSETYAQIQPMQSNSIVVSVEINNSSTLNRLSDVPKTSCQMHDVTLHTSASIVPALTGPSTSITIQKPQTNSRPTSDHFVTPIPPPVDSLRAQMHSRQASSSSNNSSSINNLGSPKPEKRQANSPLPPTPKSNTQLSTGSSSTNLTSGRNSVISVIECGGGSATPGILDINAVTSVDISPQRLKTTSLSPSKDIEGMYAKVMKKNKLSHHSPSSTNNSPVLTRKFSNEQNHLTLGVSPLDTAAAELMESNKISMNATNDKSRMRSNSNNAKDHGYETIPADSMRCGTTVGVEHRKSDCYTSILQKELDGGGLVHGVGNSTKIPLINSDTHLNYRNEEKYYETIAGPMLNTNKAISLNSSDPGYETLNKNSHYDPDNEKKSSDYDPNYEVLKTNVAGLSDDGYAKVVEKKRLNLDEDGEEDSIDGYSKVKVANERDDAINAGYSTIGESNKSNMATATDANHNYASILETKNSQLANDETECDHYARISESHIQSMQPPLPPPQTPDLLPLKSIAMPANVMNESQSPAVAVRTFELAITSPSSMNSSSIFTNSSTPISNMTTTTSSSTMSSRPTPTSSSQYESLTGSDTDPNYESVSYLNTTETENPYERLPTDYSDNQLSNPLLTPDEPQRQHDTKVKIVSTITAIQPNGTKSLASDTEVVDDYFHV